MASETVARAWYWMLCVRWDKVVRHWSEQLCAFVIASISWSWRADAKTYSKRNSYIIPSLNCFKRTPLLTCVLLHHSQGNSAFRHKVCTNHRSLMFVMWMITKYNKFNKSLVVYCCAYKHFPFLMLCIYSELSSTIHGPMRGEFTGLKKFYAIM